MTKTIAEQLAEIKMKPDYVSGDGTLSDPIIYKFSNFILHSGLAQIMGYTEDLSYVQKNTWVNGFYYRYYIWKRGASIYSAYNTVNKSNILYTFGDLRSLGYNLLKTDLDLGDALLNLDMDGVESGLLTNCDRIWKEISHKKDLPFKVGERYSFYKGDELVEGEVIKASTKRLFLRVDAELELPIFDYKPNGGFVDGVWKYRDFKKI